MNNEINASSSAVIIKELTKAQDIIETAYSFIMLGEKDVYKFYKPTDFCLVENRLNNNRKKYTMFEADFNQKFSNGIYGDVLKIIRKSEKEFGIVSLENSLAAIDYIVKMNRVSDDYKLSNLIFNNKLNKSDYETIGSNLFQILDSQEKYTLEKGLYSKYLKDFINTLLTYIKDNTKITYNNNKDVLDKINKIVSVFEKSLHSFIDENTDVLENRYNKGYIKQGHGNIKLKHILFNSPYSAKQYGDNINVGLMDALIFNPKYRNIDMLLELMILVVDFNFIVNSSENLMFYLGNNYFDTVNINNVKTVIDNGYIDNIKNGFESEFNNKYGDKEFGDEFVTFYYRLSYLIKFVEVCSFLKDANGEWSFYDELTNYMCSNTLSNIL